MILPFQRDAFIARLKTYLGYHETGNNDTPFGEYYGINRGEWASWCAMFPGYVMDKMGWDIRTLSPHFYATVLWYRELSPYWKEIDPRNIRIGDVIFIDWGESRNPDKIDHVCVAVENITSGQVAAIHGNLHDSVCIANVALSTICRVLRPPYAPATAGIPAWPGIYLSIGSRGPWVAFIQGKLGVTNDGIFGPITRKAVIGFQKRSGLDTDGIVGPLTWKALFQ